MSHDTGEAAERLVPDFADLSEEVKGLEQIVEQHRSTIIVARARARDAEAGIKVANSAISEATELWVKGLADTDPLYSASHYLEAGEHPFKHGLDLLESLHKRGVMICELARQAEVEPLPVLGVMKTDAEVTVETRGYRQGEAPKKSTKTFRAVVGRTRKESALSLEYKKETAETGTVTVTPDSLSINMSDDTVGISSNLTSWNYRGGSEAWLETPTKAVEPKSIKILGKANRRPRNPNKLAMSYEESVFGFRTMSSYELYVGSAAVELAVESLTNLQDTSHDEAALKQILETVEEIL